MFDIHCFGIVQ